MKIAELRFEAKALRLPPRPLADVALKPLGQDQALLTSRYPLAGSVLRLDDVQPELKEKAIAAEQALGLPTSGITFSVPSADLVYTTNKWKTTNVVQANYMYLRDGNYGFKLPEDLKPGSELNYAIHAHVNFSAGSIPSSVGKADFWLNNHGWNYLTRTSPNP